MNDKNTEIRVRFEIGDIKFEAEGPADLVERERSIFTTTLLPTAVEAVVRTRGMAQTSQYLEVREQPMQLLSEGMETDKADPISAQGYGEDYSRTNLVSFLKKYGTLSEQDFILFSAYFDEVKNDTKYFTKNEAEKYYDDARRTKPANISMCLNQLAQKGLIMDAANIEQKTPKPYCISNDGINYIKSYTPKDEKERRPAKPRKARVKTKSDYATINCDELNLDKYPEIKGLQDFKEKMMMVLYIITNEGKGEWFTTYDVLCLLTDIFGEAATKDQVNGVFKREKLWFKTESVEGNGKEVKRKDRKSVV